MNRKNTKGYCLHKTSKKWMAYIEKKGNRINLGLFTKENDARKARKKAEKKYFGEYANKN